MYQLETKYLDNISKQQLASKQLRVVFKLNMKMHFLICVEWNQIGPPTKMSEMQYFRFSLFVWNKQ